MSFNGLQKLQFLSFAFPVPKVSQGAGIRISSTPQCEQMLLALLPGARYTAYDGLLELAVSPWVHIAAAERGSVLAVPT